MEVIMYWKPGCPYCASAEALLRQKGITPIKFRIDNDSNLRAEMIEKAVGAKPYRKFLSMVAILAVVTIFMP